MRVFLFAVAAVVAVTSDSAVAQAPALKPSQHPAEPSGQTASKGKEAEWPRVLKKDSTPQVSTWSEAEVAAGRSQCDALLKGLAIVALPAPPIRDGVECGAAAPVELVSVGQSPQVTFSPTVTVTCEMAVALHKWITQDLQPLARRHLGSEVIRVDTMSSYSCRPAYGRAHGRLSEHGKANALDIRSFLLAKGDTADVLANWGPTARDIQAQVAAAQAAARKAEAERAAAAAAEASQKQGTPAGAPGGTRQPELRDGNGGVLTADRPASSAEEPPVLSHRSPANGGQPSGVPQVGLPGVSVQLPGLGSVGIGGSIGSPSRLGGPKQGQQSVVVRPLGADSAAGRTQFLREAHRTGCRAFATMLGPEANNAHRNHFHVDLAQRRNAVSICE
jgi:hypothetical protein